MHNTPNPDVNTPNTDSDSVNNQDIEQINDKEKENQEIPVPPDTAPPASIEEPPDTQKPAIDEDGSDPKMIV